MLDNMYDIVEIIHRTCIILFYCVVIVWYWVLLELNIYYHIAILTDTFARFVRYGKVPHFVNKLELKLSMAMRWVILLRLAQDHVFVDFRTFKVKTSALVLKYHNLHICCTPIRWYFFVFMSDWIESKDVMLFEFVA